MAALSACFIAGSTERITRPGRIKDGIVVHQSHPKSCKIKTTPEFVGPKEQLMKHIRSEALKVAADA